MSSSETGTVNISPKIPLENFNLKFNMSPSSKVPKGNVYVLSVNVPPVDGENVLPVIILFGSSLHGFCIVYVV